MATIEIPKVDLNHYINGSESEKQAFIQKIGTAYQNVGFAIVQNHDISNDLIDNFYAQIKAFFNLPEETKKKYYSSELGGQRGYTPFGMEHAKGRTEGDLKEFWHFGQEVTDGDPIEKFYPKNMEVDELPEFANVGNQLYAAFEETGKNILASLAEFLALDVHYFDEKIHNGNSILRPIHYPPITSEPKSAERAAAHEDINLITLLVGASASGLEALHSSGTWIPVKPEANELVINVGDMLQRLSNGILKSTTHRVVNPPKSAWGTSRFSVPFFLHPRSDMDLSALPSTITADNPKKWDDITAGDYLTERLKEIGLIK